MANRQRLEMASLYADQWIVDYSLLTDEVSDIMYYYKNGVYHPKAEILIKELAETEYHGSCTNQFVNEIIGMIKRRTYSVFDPSSVDPELINVRNGILNIRTDELFDHTPELEFTVQLPVKYDPNASCPAIEKFFGEVVSPEDVPLLERSLDGLCGDHTIFTRQ